eukprot:COSAG06_NODE_1118_length_10635_cov_5.052946_15_plen_197_part_00
MLAVLIISSHDQSSTHHTMPGVPASERPCRASMLTSALTAYEVSTTTIEPFTITLCVNTSAACTLALLLLLPLLLLPLLVVTVGCVATVADTQSIPCSGKSSERLQSNTHRVASLSSNDCRTTVDCTRYPSSSLPCPCPRSTVIGPIFSEKIVSDTSTAEASLKLNSPVALLESTSINACPVYFDSLLLKEGAPVR